MLLGPTLIDVLHLWLFARASDAMEHSIKDFSEIGVILLMFVAGLDESDAKH